jgi:hypothetical protein
MSVLRLMTICLSVSLGCNSEPSAIAVHLKPAKTDCVVGEPLRFAISIKNVSSETLRVPPIETITDGTMLFTYFEVKHPDGHVERRRYRTHYVDGFWNFATSGAPLAPGDSIYFFAYPEYTPIRVSRNGKDKEKSFADSRTFPAPGKYRLRAVAHIWPEFKNLYAGSWRSNEVAIVVSAPDSVGARILSEVRECGASVSDGYTEGGPVRLEHLIEEHSTHPMIKYARLATAHAHRWGQVGKHNADLPRAMNDYRAIARAYPDLFPEEIQYWLANTCRDAGREDEAQQLIADLMSAHPELWTDSRFAWAGAVIGTNSVVGRDARRQEELQVGTKPLNLEPYRARPVN